MKKNQEKPTHTGLYEELHDLLNKAEARAGGKQGSVPLGHIVDAAQTRAFGLVALLAALPCCLPFVYLLPQLLAPLILCIMFAIGCGAQHLRLPRKIAARPCNMDALRRCIDRFSPSLALLNRLTRVRACSLTQGVPGRCLAGAMLVPALFILVPLPLTNSIPGVAVLLFSSGLLGRDGYYCVAGVVLGLAWSFFLTALLIFGAHGILSLS